MSDTEILASQVDAWLQPVAGAERPSGRPVPDDTFREFKSALAGKPDTQFSEEVPPDFRKVVALAEEIFVRSRDLNVAVGWCRKAAGVTRRGSGLNAVSLSNTKPFGLSLSKPSAVCDDPSTSSGRTA